MWPTHLHDNLEDLVRDQGRRLVVLGVDMLMHEADSVGVAWMAKVSRA